MRSVVLWASLVVILLVANVAVLGKERTVRTGTVVFLELAPRDPRSILQGDYMALRYVLTREIGNQRRSEISASGHVVVSLDSNGVASFVRFDDGSGAAAGERLLKFRKRGGRVRVASDAFFFEEGSGPVYQRARYGELRVDDDGNAVLVGLRDEDLRPLGPARR